MITKTIQTAFAMMQALGQVGYLMGLNFFRAMMPNVSPTIVKTVEKMMIKPRFMLLV